MTMSSAPTELPTRGEQRKYYTEETISVFQSAHYTTLINDY